MSVCSRRWQIPWRPCTAGRPVPGPPRGAVSDCEVSAWMNKWMKAPSWPKEETNGGNFRPWHMLSGERHLFKKIYWSMVDLQGCIISKETFFEYHMKQIFWTLPGGLTASLPMQPYLGIIWIFYCIDSKWFITRNGKLKDTHYKDVKLNKANLI